MIMIGRANLLGGFETKSFATDGHPDENGIRMQNQIASVARAREVIMETDAGDIVRVSLSRPLRTNASAISEHRDYIRAYQKAAQERVTRRHGGFRVLCVGPRHLEVERGAKLRKMPVHLRRKVAVSEEEGELRLGNQAPSQIAEPNPDRGTSSSSRDTMVVVERDQV